MKENIITINENMASKMCYAPIYPEINFLNENMTSKMLVFFDIIIIMGIILSKFIGN